MSRTIDARASGQQDRSILKRAVTGAMAGTVMEWYEFFIYGTAAALVFSKTFFPNSDNPLDAVLAAFLTYAIGFVARPVGGLVFGHLGDKVGRKKLLQVSLLMIGSATFLMGMLPDFSVWGYAAPIALAVLRFIQGIAVGGEWGGAILLVGEHSPPNERGFWSSFPQAAASVGNVLASIVLLGSSMLMSEEAFLSWGWRVAFWLSALIVIIGYYIRKNVEDAPIFKEAAARQEEYAKASSGLGAVVTQYPKQMIKAILIHAGENAVYYIIVAFTLTYLTLDGSLGSSDVLLIMFIANIFQFVAQLVAGKLSDRIGRKNTFLIGAVLLLAWIPFYFPALNTGNFAVILIAVIFGLCVQGTMYAPQAALYGELFPTRARYSGVSASYQVASVIGGAMAPIIATWLWGRFDSWIPIAVYMFVYVVIGLGVMIFGLKETRGTRLEDIDAADYDKFIAEETTESHQIPVVSTPK